MEYVVFEQDFLDIPLQDLPEYNVCIALDPQKRLGEKTWSVVYMDGMTPKPTGLFWDFEDAERYAKAYCEDN